MNKSDGKAELTRLGMSNDIQVLDGYELLRIISFVEKRHGIINFNIGGN